MSDTLLRFPIYLTEADWKALGAGFEKRVRRFRSAVRLGQASRVRAALSAAAADCIPDEDDAHKYVVHLSEDDYGSLLEAVMNHRNGLPREDAQRVTTELFRAAGDAIEA
ncbi:hypothetical protein [Streptomyces sp. DG1A-41]|uniref:hypothetical protein n=1 Tax=Streptomyces sp. DG1A-41 TaxID=3125779 RepID=UPI0030CDB2D8